MKQAYFIVANSAHVFPGAKMVIVGTFDTIYAKAVPFMFEPLGVAVRLYADRAEEGKEYEGVLRLQKAGGKNPTFEMNVAFGFPESEGEAPSSALLALMIGPLRFEEEGHYVFEILVDKKPVAWTDLYVRVREEPSGQGNP